MPKGLTSGKPTSRRYSIEEKPLPWGLSSGWQRTVQRVTMQLAYSIGSVRVWAKQADRDDGAAPG